MLFHSFLIIRNGIRIYYLTFWAQSSLQHPNKFLYQIGIHYLTFLWPVAKSNGYPLKYKVVKSKIIAIGGARSKRNPKVIVSALLHRYIYLLIYLHQLCLPLCTVP